MAPPSCLPSAASIAAEAKQKYDARYGASRPPLVDSIEQQAEFFFEREELASVYLRDLIDHHAFAGPPNEGHIAIADMMIVHGVQTAVTTNVDSMIEAGGATLYGQIATGTTAPAMLALPADSVPLLKIHGCWTQSDVDTIWAPGQVTNPPFSERLAASAQWLQMRLANADLLVVGYYSDWDYLNNALSAALDGVLPSRIIIVNPDETVALEQKASKLTELGEQVGGGFFHVKESGATFLSALRAEFSRTFVRGVLHAGAQAYAEVAGAAPTEAWLEPVATDPDVLWQIRRDCEGVAPFSPAKLKVPPAEPLIGLTMLQLLAAGATSAGSMWLVNGKRVRLIRTPNQLLHQAQARHKRDISQAVSADITVAVGAESSPFLADVVRGDTIGNVVRGANARWMTRGEAVTELDL